MAALISHAQNFEDVMLWRALGHVQRGRYIDIGAQDPLVDSVSLLFHERGWRGIHVEPVPGYSERLRAGRPGDRVIQAAVAARGGTLRFFEVPGTGLGTPNAALAKRHAKSGREVREVTVPAVTLDDVLGQARGEVHWLKIDVEGGEKQVLEGWKASRKRPWIVVIESTVPLTQAPSHKAWERLVAGKGYQFAYFDGLNRFYVSGSHPELLAAFASGPNVFDGFSIGGHGTSAMHVELNARVSALEAEVARVRRETEETLLARGREHTNQWRIREEEFDKERQWLGNERGVLAERLAASERAAMEAAGALARREQQINDREGTRIAASARLAQALSDRLRSFEGRVEAAHKESLALAQRLAEREAELDARIAALLAEVAERDERQRAAEAEAQRLLAELQRREEEGQRQREEIGALGEAHADLAGTAGALREALAAARAEADAAPAVLAAREREFATQLAAKQTETAAQLAAKQAEIAAQLAAKQAEIAKLAGVLAAREAAFEAQLRASQQEARDAYTRMVGRDRDNALQLRTLRGALRAAEHDRIQVEATLHGHVATLRREAREDAAALRAREEALEGEAEARGREIERREKARAAIDRKLEALRKDDREAAQALLEAMASLRHDLGAWRAGAKPSAAPHWSELLAEPLRRPGPAASLAALLAHEGRAFVECAYATLLARQPDRVGLEYYLGRLNAGYSKLHLLGQILDSREARGASASLEGLAQSVAAYRRGTLPLVGPLLAKGERDDAVSSRLRAVEQALVAFERSAFLRAQNAERVLAAMGEINAQAAAQSEAVKPPPPEPARMAQWPERTRALYARLRRESAVRFPEAA